MTNRYFDKFSIINYNGYSMINITERTAILNSIINDKYSFYPYVVKNGMRAEQVAERYYGSQDLVWLVYFANNIVDPYHQWTMSEYAFNSYINDKYGSEQDARQKIIYYRVNWYEDDRRISTNTYRALPANEKKYWTPDYDQYSAPSEYFRKQIDHTVNAQDNAPLGIAAPESSYWSPVTAYDLEHEDNTNKASIRLLDSRLAPIAVSNLTELLGG